MDISQETHRLLGQKLMGTFDSSDYVDWAVKLISSGQESESLLILAGMDNDSSEEREKYFWQSVDELKIEINKVDYELIDNYAIKLAEQVVGGQVEPRTGLSKMLEIVRRTDYDNKYMGFIHLDEEIDQWTHDRTLLFDQEPLEDGIDSYIIKEFRTLIETNSK